jgi:hypothetical protein
MIQIEKDPLKRPLVFGDREQINAIKRAVEKAESKNLQVKHQGFNYEPKSEVTCITFDYNFKCPECNDTVSGNEELDPSWNEDSFELDCDCGLKFTYDNGTESIIVSD